MITKLKRVIKKIVPSPLLMLLRILTNSNIRNWILKKDEHTLIEKYKVLTRLYFADESSVTKAHSFTELFTVVKHIMSTPKSVQGYIVEAGSYKGASALKLSIVAKATGRKFAIFDSFEGIPDNHEEHDINIYGKGAGFKKGDYTGSLEEVKSNISKYGSIEVCQFHKGWFEDTMPDFKENIIAAYIDVDLVSSTKTCIKYLWPLLVEGGRIFSQDGHLPLVIEAVDDDKFWKDEIGIEKPDINGLGHSKLISFGK